MHYKRIDISFKRFQIEAFIWLSALVSLATMDPNGESHFTLCIFKNLGFSFCPGCGLGHSIASTLKGSFIEGFQFHPLGLVAILMLLYRIFTIFKQYPLITINKNK